LRKYSLIVGAAFIAIIIVSYYASGMGKRPTNEELEEVPSVVK
jgi:hypothetical protein